MARWTSSIDPDTLFLSVVILGELRRGVEVVRHRGDTSAADALLRWLHDLENGFDERVLPITSAIGHRWGQLGVPDPVSPLDAYLAATALEYDLAVATRNTRDFTPTGVSIVNPFESWGD